MQWLRNHKTHRWESMWFVLYDVSVCDYKNEQKDRKEELPPLQHHVQLLVHGGDAYPSWSALCTSLSDQLKEHDTTCVPFISGTYSWLRGYKKIFREQRTCTIPFLRALVHVFFETANFSGESSPLFWLSLSSLLWLLVPLQERECSIHPQAHQLSSPRVILRWLPLRSKMIAFTH